MTSDPNLTPNGPATPAAPADDAKPSLDLSIPKVAGGALAAVTTAVAASFLGVNGTLTGAAFGSVVSSIAAAIYAASLQTAHSKIRTTRSVVLRTATDDGRAAVAIDPNDPTTVPPELTHHTLPLPGRADVRAAGPGAVPGPLPTSAPAGSRLRLSWKPIAALAALIFVAAMTVIFGTELVIGHPISNSQDSGTSFGQLVGADPEPEHTRPAPTPSVSPSDTATVSTVTGTSDPETSGTDSSSPSGSASPSASGSGNGTSDQTQPVAPTGDGQPAGSGQPSASAPSGGAADGVPTP